jgi:hypothetical protein
VDHIARRGVDDVRERGRGAVAVEVRRADEQAIAERGERPAEVAAVLGNRDATDGPPVRLGVARESDVGAGQKGQK